MSKALDVMSVAELDALIDKARQVRDDTRERRRKELKAEVEAKLRSEAFMGRRGTGRSSGLETYAAEVI